MKVKCPDCLRAFDLLTPADAEEWSYWHDCEVGPAVQPVEGQGKGRKGMAMTTCKREGCANETDFGLCDPSEHSRH